MGADRSNETKLGSTRFEHTTAVHYTSCNYVPVQLSRTSAPGLKSWSWSWSCDCFEVLAFLSLLLLQGEQPLRSAHHSRPMPDCARQQSNSQQCRSLSRTDRLAGFTSTKCCLCERHIHASNFRALRITGKSARLPKAVWSTHMSKLIAQSTLLNHDGVASQQQRQGSLAATNIPPTAETVLLGPRVEHLAATEDGTLLDTISQQLQLPSVNSQPAHLKNACSAMLSVLQVPAQCARGAAT